MEVFLDRLLIELVAIGVQFAFFHLLAWIRERSAASDQLVAVPTAA